MRPGFGVLDTHALLGRARHSGRTDTVDGMLSRMDAAGVDRALLIPFRVVVDFGRECDEIGAALRHHPDRFAGAACPNPCIPERGCVAAAMPTASALSTSNRSTRDSIHPLSEGSDSLFETALENRMALLFHTGAGALLALESIVAGSACSDLWIESSFLMPHTVLELLARVGSDQLMTVLDFPENVNSKRGTIFSLAVCDEDKREILRNTPAHLFGSEPGGTQARPANAGW